MSDPLSEVISLLRPRAAYSKVIAGAGRWGVRYPPISHPGFGTVLEGSCRLVVKGCEPIDLAAGDFVLLPSMPGFDMTGFEPVEPTIIDPDAALNRNGEVRHGDDVGEADVRILGGYFEFESPDASFLVTMLPPLLHLRDAGRLAALVRMVADEASEQRPGRDLILSRLIEIMLVEALRSFSPDTAPPGMLRGLADPRISLAIKQIHATPERGLSIADLARHAAMSRSSFFDRFMRVVGVPPMEYLLIWRMALAKDMLRRGRLTMADVAERVGYSSASTFSTAFAKFVGIPPGRYARALRLGAET